MKTSLLRSAVRNSDIESPKNLVCFQKGSYTVYRDVLESRHIGRAFKLVNPKHEEQASVCNDNSLGLN